MKQEGWDTGERREVEKRATQKEKMDIDILQRGSLHIYK